MKSGFGRAPARSVVAWIMLLLAFCMMAPASAAGQIVIEPPSGALPDATTKVAYHQTFTASGGAAPYTFSLLQYPGGMSLSTDGVLSGAAHYGGDYDVIIKVTDAAQNSHQQSYTLRVNRPSIILSPQSLPDPVWGTPYDALVSADGGQAPYSFKATPENPLPDGLTISDGGRISGTPTTRGHFSTVLVATDANGNTGVQGLDIIVKDQPITIAPDNLPDSTSGAPYRQQLSASGGTAPYRFDPEPGQFFDDNFSLSSDGLITGTPGSQGTTTLSVRVTDSNGNVAVKRYGLTILRPAIILAPDSVASGKAGQPYQATFTAAGGVAPYSFSWLGSLPNGVSLSAGGVLSGTPRSDGTYEFVIRVQDADGQTGERSYSLVIAEALDISPDTLPQLQVGQPFSQALTVTGGTGSYSFSYGGALPPGMRLYAHGEFSGTPTQAGTYEFLAAAGDSTGLSGRQSYTVTVVDTQPVITLSPATVSGGKVGEAYSQLFTAEGGTAPYEFTAPGAGLPAGLTLALNGTLSGTPMTAGSYSFSVEAKDADGRVGSRSYDLAIAAPTITITPASLPQAMLGVPYRQTLTAAGGAARRVSRRRA